MEVSLVVKARTEEGVEETLPIVGLLAHIHLIPVLLNHRCHSLLTLSLHLSLVLKADLRAQLVKSVGK